MSDGSRLRQYWYKALSDAESQFRQLVASPATDWKRVVATTDGAGNKKGKARASAVPEPNDVAIHRYLPRKSGDDIYRLVLDVPTADDSVCLDHWKAVLTTPELRQEWDPAVIDAHLVEQFDITTRVCKTNFTLGWPANPRDAVTISRSFSDATTVIDISTSLPRSADEPAFLRPAPPYVRSNVALFAWCIQHAQPPPQPPPPTDPSGRRKSISLSTGRLRITCFWQHDLRAMWNIGSSTGMVQQLSTMVVGLLKTVLKRGSRVPRLLGYGNGISIERIHFQTDREALTIDYSIVPEDEDHGEHSSGLEELRAVREHRRLTRSVECLLPSSDGWDVQVLTQASSIEVESLPWTANAIRNISSSSQSDSLIFCLSHAPLLDDHSILKVRVTIEISGPSSGLWLNGVSQPIQEAEDIRSPAIQAMPIFQDVASISTSFTTDSINTTSSALTSVSTTSSSTFVRQQPTERTAAAEKSILARVKRNYIYFSSLLQEPEAKWKRTTEARGVTITQLDSIDPTLVVYRAEATFVGVGLWDLFGAVNSPGARYYWDKQYEDANLLEHVNELTELWHFKTKPAWPVVGRDSVVLKTVYKSPTAIHVFAFSADDPHLFPSIPPVDPNVIRTQVDLQGWAIESLSPTTTLLTLLEQSDPKGWTNKTSIPTLMINALAGIGDFVIKCGGPPVVTRLAGAKANELRYDHEKLCFRVEYETPGHQQQKETETTGESTSATPVVECEIRCDIDGWAPSLDIVVDPPPQTISCLRRHRLAEEGGGLWMTIVHDGVFANDERLLTIVRRAPGKEKGVVMINGTRMTVDVEELPEQEIKKLTRRKRVKPTRIPLDQPPVASVIRRRRAEWGEASSDPEPPPSTNSSWGLSTPRISASPLSRFFTFTSQEPPSPSPLPSTSKPPLHHALDALSHLQSLHTSLNSTEWTPITGLVGWDKSLPITKSSIPSISSTIPIHKTTKILQGVSADEISSLILDSTCRKRWEPKYFQSETVLERYPGDGKVWFSVSKIPVPVPVPFLGLERGFYGVSLRGRTTKTSSTREAIYCVSTSVNPCPNGYDKSRYNPSNIPLGTIHLDGWILETLDPYDTSENYAVPSCRVTRAVCVDFGGNVVGSLNGVLNVGMLKGVLGVESLVLGMRGGVPVTRFPGIGVVLKSPSSAAKEEGEPDSPGGEVWKVKRKDECRTLVSCGFESEGRVYKSWISVTMVGRKGNDPPTLRNRSSTFALRHTPRSDFLVGELVIDSKLYPDGYSIQLGTLLRQGESPVPLDSVLQSGENSDEDVLPLEYSLHTIPNSALYSSGINAMTPTRHLLRLTLPTGRYEVSTVKDPLSGEVQEPPEKPKWLKQLSEEGLQGLICIVIKPAEKKKKDGVVAVSKGEKVEEVVVVDEKESLTSVGREELMDERISRMDIASKEASKEASSSAEPNPRVIGVADKLLAIIQGVELTPSATSDEKTENQEKASEEKTNLSDGRNEATVEAKGETAGPAVSMRVPGGYVHVWTTVIIAVIAFLMGSLVRSLVTPADFVYEGSEKGWREIRRLIEIKYIVGGWDLQIAVVRR